MLNENFYNGLKMIQEIRTNRSMPVDISCYDWCIQNKE